jgi:hypothetical protein
VRTEARGQEFAIRAALGAGWRKIAPSLLVESILLGIMGGVAGLARAATTLPVLLSLTAQELPSVVEITIDPTMLSFAIAISLGSGLLFGLIPVLKYASPQVAAMLSGSGRSHSPNRERHRARNSLVVMQVALHASGRFRSDEEARNATIRTFRTERRWPTGFEGAMSRAACDRWRSREMLWCIGYAAGSIIRCGRRLGTRTLDRARLQRILATGSRRYRHSDSPTLVRQGLPAVDERGAENVHCPNWYPG